MASLLTYNGVIDIIRDIAQRHYQINTFQLGKDWELENNEDIIYPILQVYPEVARMPQRNGDYKTINISLVCKVIDLVNQDEINEKDIHSDTLQIAQDIVNEINQHPYYQRSNANIIGDINFTSLEEFEDDYTAGWQFNLELQLINHNSYCGLPFEEIPGYSVNGPNFSGEIYSVQYLTCKTVTGCTSLQEYIDSKIAEIPTSTGTNVQPGSNITTGGTANNPTINLVDSPSINNLNFSGTSTGPFVVSTGITSDYIQFNTGATTTASIGRLRWNDADGTVDLGLKGGNVNLQIGQEQIVRAVNKTGANLLQSEYKVVYVTGATGQRLTVRNAQANSEVTSSTSLGVVTENIDNNQEGFITTFGRVRNINTTGSLQGETWNDGDILYLSPTVAGGITNVRPTAPNHKVTIGYVEYAHANHGHIFVKIDNGYEIGELHDVRITGTTANQSFLNWNSSQQVWQPTQIIQGVHNPIMFSGSPVPYSHSFGANAPTTVGHSANRFVLFPYIPCVTHTTVSLGLEVTTTGATNARILVYSDSNSRPLTKLIESTNLDCTTTGIKTFSTGFTFNAGTRYWLGVHSSGNVTYRGFGVGACLPIGASTTFLHNMYLNTVTFGSAPTTCDNSIWINIGSQSAPMVRITI